MGGCQNHDNTNSALPATKMKPNSPQLKMRSWGCGRHTWIQVWTSPGLSLSTPSLLACFLLKAPQSGMMPSQLSSSRKGGSRSGTFCSLEARKGSAPPDLMDGGEDENDSAQSSQVLWLGGR